MLVVSAIAGAVAGLALLAGPVVALPPADGSGQAVHQKRNQWEIDMQTLCHKQLGDEWTAIKKGTSATSGGVHQPGHPRTVWHGCAVYCAPLYGSSSLGPAALGTTVLIGGAIGK